MAVNFNVTSVINIEENENSQDPLSVSQLGFNEIVEDFCDLLEETNIDHVVLIEALFVRL